MAFKDLLTEEIVRESPSSSIRRITILSLPSNWTCLRSRAITYITSDKESEPPSAKHLLTDEDDDWLWKYNMAKWEPNEDYAEASPSDGSLIEFPPPWQAYLKAKAMDGSPKPTIPTSTSPTPEHAPPIPAVMHAEPYFTIKESPKGGYGAFASQDIPNGTVIHEESHLLSINGYYELEQKFDELNDEQKETILNMVCFQDGNNRSKLRNIFGVNNFNCDGTLRVFETACRFNHACAPRRNVLWGWRKEIGKMVFTTVKAVKKDEELTISYGHSPWQFPFLYGFECDCGCDSERPRETDAEMRARVRREERQDQAYRRAGWRNMSWRAEGCW